MATSKRGSIAQSRGAPLLEPSSAARNLHGPSVACKAYWFDSWPSVLDAAGVKMRSRDREGAVICVLFQHIAATDDGKIELLELHKFHLPSET